MFTVSPVEYMYS